jgi:hypothetical protein
MESMVKPVFLGKFTRGTDLSELPVILSNEDKMPLTYPQFELVPPEFTTGSLLLV